VSVCLFQFPPYPAQHFFVDVCVSTFILLAVQLYAQAKVLASIANVIVIGGLAPCAKKRSSLLRVHRLHEEDQILMHDFEIE